ncbi:carbohydrate ABC transporter permease [Paenibacillus hemerocallicola]|uniref:Carbohydrate ABC transporter permease n=1 Tax=Paenibacillus hemerocallicola TaxID=1172614 RepID=A0A5C4T9U5_9BACL|nr:carbohydrate ABC transporter permease [Paenibacillus hemerocallicola]TNJ65380.1 carbohydrate ABC transporter permease [Paenibacillus hemerocallicola]
MIRGINIRKLLATALMLAFGLVFLLPFAWMISSSMKPEADVFQYPIRWIPEHFQAVKNYTDVWAGQYPFYLYYLNSIKVTLITTFVSVLVSCMAAYAFAKIRFAGSGASFMIVLATYMIPSQAILVPQFILFRQLGLFDTHLGLVLLNCFSVLGTFMLRQFFLGIHSEYMEAAKIDGAGHWRTFFRIGIPLVKPAIATYAILRFIWTWNDYQNPLIFLKSPDLFTLPLGIKKFADAYGEFYSLMMAASVSAIIPLLIIFIVGQKQVIEGISLGGVKG